MKLTLNITIFVKNDYGIIILAAPTSKLRCLLNTS